MFLNLQAFSFEGQNMKFTVNMLLTCICDAGPACLFRTVCKHSMLICITDIIWRHRSFTSRKLYVCPLRFLYVSCIYLIARCVGLFHSKFQCSCLHATLLTVLRIVHTIGQLSCRLSSGKTMVSILYVDLISCAHFLITLSKFSFGMQMSQVFTR